MVQHVILFQPFEYQGLITLPSKILSNQGHMTFSAKLSNLLYIKLKIAYITPSFLFYLGGYTCSVYMKVNVAYTCRHSPVQS